MGDHSLEFRNMQEVEMQYLEQYHKLIKRLGDK